VPAPAPTDQAPAPDALRRASRAALRQLAAAVYARVVFALVAGQLPASWPAIHAASLALTGLAAALLALAVEGTLLEAGLVGFLCAGFDLAVGWAFLAADAAPTAFLLEHLPPALDEGVAGLLGAHLVLRARAKTAGEKAAEKAPAPSGDVAP